MSSQKDREVAGGAPARIPPQEPTDECDQCGAKRLDYPGWTSERCPTLPYGSCDGTMRAARIGPRPSLEFSPTTLHYVADRIPNSPFVGYLRQLAEYFETEPGLLDKVAASFRLPRRAEEDVFIGIEDVLAKHCRGFMDRPTTRENIVELIDKICDTQERTTQELQALKLKIELEPRRAEDEERREDLDARGQPVTIPSTGSTAPTDKG